MNSLFSLDSEPQNALIEPIFTDKNSNTVVTLPHTVVLKCLIATLEV